MVNKSTWIDYFILFYGFNLSMKQRSLSPALYPNHPLNHRDNIGKHNQKEFLLLLALTSGND